MSTRRNGEKSMSDEIDIAKLYINFENAMTEVLAEHEFDLARRAALFDARAQLMSHSDANAHEYKKVVERAFQRSASARNAMREAND
jgi:hypothetical protein